LKFGRPGRVVALTLPDDVVAWLGTLHEDPAWAVVSLYEQETRQRPASSTQDPPPVVDLATIGRRQSLIVVQQDSFTSLAGVDLIPLAETGYAFLALRSGTGLGDLELAVLDRLDEPGVSAAERQQLILLRAQLRAWRFDPQLSFSQRSIIVVEHRAPETSGRRGRG
jgi:hypothetical protein